MELTLGIDLGTSYFKLGLFDRAGQLRGLGRVGVLKSNVNGLQRELTVKNFWALLREGTKLCLQRGWCRCFSNTGNFLQFPSEQLCPP